MYKKYAFLLWSWQLFFLWANFFFIRFVPEVRGRLFQIPNRAYQIGVHRCHTMVLIVYRWTLWGSDWPSRLLDQLIYSLSLEPLAIIFLFFFSHQPCYDSETYHLSFLFTLCRPLVCSILYIRPTLLYKWSIEFGPQKLQSLMTLFFSFCFALRTKQTLWVSLNFYDGLFVSWTDDLISVIFHWD